MKERKYKEQYKLIDEMDSRGHINRTAVYTGRYYVWQADDARQKRCRVTWLIGMLSITACILGYLLANTPGSRCIYVLPILIIGLFPALYGCIGAVNVYRQPRKLTIVQRENGIGRLVRSAFGAALTASIALIGDVIFLFTTAQPASETPGTALIALTCFLGWLCFADVRKGWHAMQELPEQ